jgi:Histidine-specific methyltransferase, SAM-dependent
MTSAGKKGIREWLEKRHVLDTLFSVWTNDELATKVLGSRSTPEEQAQVAGSFKSWKNHHPTGTSGRLFCSRLADRFLEMGSEESNAKIRDTIVNGSRDELVALLPPERRSGLKVADATSLDTTNSALDETHVPIYVLRAASTETLRSAFERRRIDQKFHYLTPDAAAIWKAVVDCGVYRQYAECHASLSLLCESEPWKAFFKDGAGKSCVMLGCGAPSKDILLINAMLGAVPSGTSVNYTMIDFSNFMLKSSSHAVDSIISNHGMTKRVKLHRVEDDFQTLNSREKLLSEPTKPAIWLITGGTIGNINERDFFSSMRRVTRPDDLLVIGAETVSPDISTPPIDVLRKKYDTPEVRRFVETPLHSLWREMGWSSEDLQKALKRIAVDVVDGVEHGHSTVRNSLSVEVSLMVNNRNLVLLTSTRYEEAELVSFAGGNGFELVDSIASPLNTNYKQMVFRISGPTPHQRTA